MSVRTRVKRFFANTIHGYGEVFKHNYVDFEVVSRKLMCDIRAFGKEIMDLPEDTDIQRKDEESENENASVHQSPKSTRTFNIPDFGSELNLDLESVEKSQNYESPHLNEAGDSDTDFDESASTFRLLSPEKKGYEHDSDFEPEKESIENLKKRKHAPKVEWNGKRFKRVYTVERYIDFTKGQTRINKKLQETDEDILRGVNACLVNNEPFWFTGGVFYKCARNWDGLILPGLVVTDKGHFFLQVEGKGVFRKPVSTKDRFLYHDSMRILAPRIVFCSFAKDHPGLHGESEEEYYFKTCNGSKYNLSIDNLQCIKGTKAHNKNAM